jgi:hypothetical protein
MKDPTDYLNKTQAHALIREGLGDLATSLEVRIPELTELIAMQSAEGTAKYQQRVIEIVEGVDRRWQARLRKGLQRRRVAGKSAS